MAYKQLPDTIVLGGVAITSKYDKTPMNATIHFDTKLGPGTIKTTSLCGIDSVYSWYSDNAEEVSCKRCLKKLGKKNEDL